MHVQKKFSTLSLHLLSPKWYGVFQQTIWTHSGTSFLNHFTLHVLIFYYKSLRNVHTN